MYRLLDSNIFSQTFLILLNYSYPSSQNDCQIALHFFLDKVVLKYSLYGVGKLTSICSNKNIGSSFLSNILPFINYSYK